MSRIIFLEENGVTSQGAIVISESLRGNATLERLFISHNMIGDKGIKALAQSLSGNYNVTIKEFSLSYNSITDDSVEHLADMLASNKTLTHLRLVSNQIDEHGLKRLGAVLALEWNRLSTDSSVDILINILQKNQSLTQLSLNSCKLSLSATKKVKAAAKSKKKFELTIH